ELRAHLVLLNFSHGPLRWTRESRLLTRRGFHRSAGGQQEPIGSALGSRTRRGAKFHAGSPDEAAAAAPAPSHRGLRQVAAPCSTLECQATAQNDLEMRRSGANPAVLKLCPCDNTYRWIRDARINVGFPE